MSQSWVRQVWTSSEHADHAPGGVLGQALSEELHAPATSSLKSCSCTFQAVFRVATGMSTWALG